jgi:Glycosyl transferases group 1
LFDPTQGEEDFLIDLEACCNSWAGMSSDDDEEERRRRGNETGRPPRSPIPPSSSSSSLSTTASSSGRISGRRGHLEEPPQAQPPPKPPFFFCTRKNLRKAVACAVILAALVLQQKQAQSLSRTLSQAMAGATNAEAPPQEHGVHTASSNATHHHPSDNSTYVPSSSSTRLVESLLAEGLTRCVNQGGTAGGTWVSRRSRNCTSKDNKDRAIDMGRDSTNSSSSNHEAANADRSNNHDGVDVRASASASEAAIPRPAAAAAASSSILAEHAVVQIPAHLLHRANHSLLKRFNNKVPVVVWPLCETGIGNAVSMHLQTNGIQESPYMELSHNLHNFDPDVVWVGDAGSGARSRSWCNHFYDRVYNATMRRKELGLNTSWPIYIIDYTDYTTRQRCHNVEQLVGHEFVSYSKRSVVLGRRWKYKSSWVEVGRVANLRDDDGNVTYRHTPFIVRTDTVKSLQVTLKERGLALHDPIERIDRPVDVTHLWPRSSGSTSADRGGVGEVESHLRTLVSDEIWRYKNDAKLRNWTVLVGLAGSPTRVGRQSVASAYLNAMLSTKIMVVTQRDGWEDHYRLFEALVSGAMVMTDQMLSLPSGLQNGTSLVEFGSLRELLSLLDYYLFHQEERLQIATEGRRVAMLRHRSWHRIEEVIFGRPLTLCEEGNRGLNQTSADCPYVVHANESIQVS